MRTVVLVSTGVVRTLDLARRWAQAGDVVEVVLLDAATATVRPAHRDIDAVRATVAAGIPVAAHDEALRRRGISPAAQIDGVKAVSIDEIADLVADGADKVVWL